MPIRHGTCHGGAVAFQADPDFTQPTSRCNCSFCRKTRNWSRRLADPASLTVTRGDDAMSHHHGRNAWPEPHIAHAFCRHCGTRLFTTGDTPEPGGRSARVFLPATDDAAEGEPIAAPPGGGRFGQIAHGVRFITASASHATEGLTASPSRSSTRP